MQPDVYLQPQRDEVKYLCEYAKQMSSLCEFMTPQKATKVKKFINDCIRNDNEIDPEEIAREYEVDAYTISLWKVVDMIKDVMFILLGHFRGYSYYHQDFSMIKLARENTSR